MEKMLSIISHENNTSLKLKKKKKTANEVHHYIINEMAQIKKTDNDQDAYLPGFSYISSGNLKFSTIKSNLPVSHEMKHTHNTQKEQIFSYAFTQEIGKHFYKPMLKCSFLFYL